MDIFSTATLAAIVRDLRVPQQGLAARYFGATVQSDSETIHFDTDTTARRMSVFVSPLVAGKIVSSRGFKTSTYRPAYIKDKRVFTANRALRRAMGERIGGGDYSPQQRMEALLVQDLQDQIDTLTRRMEWMAAQTLLDGAITITGQDYPTEVVDFGRDAGNTITLSGVNRWSDATSSPLDDLQDWSTTMIQSTGAALSDVIMTVDVWKVFRDHPDVKELLNRYRSTITVAGDAHNREGLVFQGNVDGFGIYTYSGWAVDPITNVESAYLPAGTVIGCAAPDLVQGVRHFGAIQDVDSLQAVPYFTKSWAEEDPSMRFLLMQTAPLLVPYRVNATLRATVL